MGARGRVGRTGRHLPAHTSLSDLHGRTYLVTGAAGAVGGAVVDLILSRGGSVVAVDALPVEHRPRLLPVVLDVSDRGGWMALRARLTEDVGRLDGLVTCAAVMEPLDGGVRAVALSAWDRTLQVNLTGALLASQAAVELATERAVIVHVGSVVASRASATAQLAYTSTKGAVAAMSRELAVECAPRGIRVNTLVAGVLATPLTASLVDNPAELRRRLAHIPLGRLGHAREIAQAAIWLLSDDASYVTGTELVVDGGLSAAFVTGREA